MSSWENESTDTAADVPATGGVGPVVNTTTDASAGTVTVLGKVKDGKLVKSWNGSTKVFSDRTLKAVESIGIVVIDDPAQYLF